jgi:hypothetical protein
MAPVEETTAAVNVTACPTMAELGMAEMVDVVAALFTVWDNAAEVLFVSFASPL